MADEAEAREPGRERDLDLVLVDQRAAQQNNG
jgi:hypothetical protein